MLIAKKHFEDLFMFDNIVANNEINFNELEKKIRIKL